MTAVRQIVVVGGGPAGSAAAITLAHAGVDVTVVDRARFPREKCCGDGLTTGALRRLDALGLDPAAVASFTVVDALLASSPSGRVVHVPLARADGTYAAVATRSDLDAALLDRARAEGARIITGDGVTDVDHAAGAVVLTLASGAVLTAPMIFAADGARSAVRRLVRERSGVPAARSGGLAGRDAWFAYRQYASAVSERAASQLWVRFDPALLPGYGWSFPLGGGMANIGIGLPRQPGTAGKALKAAWSEALRSAFFTSLLGERAVLEGSVRAWPIPTGVRADDCVACDGRVLFLGDAAATADPFTGEGIAQALESGVLAADAYVTGGIEDAATRYTTALGRALFTEHRMARVARTLISAPIGARAALRGTALHPRVTSFVGRWLYEEYPRTVLTRPRSWKTIRDVRPGAFATTTGPR